MDPDILPLRIDGDTIYQSVAHPPQDHSLVSTVQLPNFLLAISSLYSRLRSNIASAVVFFVTRILLHVIWCISYCIPTNRIHTTGGSILPSVMLASVFPLHALWFRGCVKGFIKRHKEDRAPVAKVITADAVSVAEVSGRRGTSFITES